MSARPASRVTKAATRYRPGKAPLGAGESYSSDEHPEDDQSAREQKEVVRENETKHVEPLGRGYAPIQSTSVSTTRAPAEIDSSEYETDTDDEDDEVQLDRPVFRAPLHVKKTVDTVTSSDGEEDDSSDETGSSSSEGTPLPMMPKPIFKSKKEREMSAAPSNSTAIGGEVDPRASAVDELADDGVVTKAIQDRKRQSHALAAARIKQELQEKEDREAKPDLDDTDGLDPEAEFQAWRQREQARVQREREADKSKDEERAEKQRRANMTEQQRLAEDLAYARKTRDEKRKGEQGFMQKYYHKGSFFQDSELLKNRDFTAMTESAVDKTLLPKMMQVRDYGKKGRSKHTHLKDEDTSQLPERNSRSCFICGGPHLRRDCPQSDDRSNSTQFRRRSRSPPGRK